MSDWVEEMTIEEAIKIKKTNERKVRELQAQIDKIRDDGISANHFLLKSAERLIDSIQLINKEYPELETLGLRPWDTVLKLEYGNISIRYDKITVYGIELVENDLITYNVKNEKDNVDIIKIPVCTLSNERMPNMDWYHSMCKGKIMLTKLNLVKVKKQQLKELQNKMQAVKMELLSLQQETGEEENE